MPGEYYFSSEEFLPESLKVAGVFVGFFLHGERIAGKFLTALNP
jgi:hypothetical protein